MFNDSDILTLGRRYFFILNATTEVINLESKNSGHFWRLVAKERRILLYHASAEDGPFHVREGFDSIESALRKIKKYDKGQLKRWSLVDNKLCHNYNRPNEFVYD